MKTVDDVKHQLAAEISHWFPRQCADPARRFYFYHLPTTSEADGGFLINAETPAHPGYILTARMSCGETVQQAFNRLLPIVMRLPILAREAR